MASRRSPPLNLTVPRALAAVYAGTPGLPILSHLLVAAMREALEAAGAEPPADPAAHPQTGAATRARTRRRQG